MSENETAPAQAGLVEETLAAEGEVTAWEEIAEGRFMPRRIRGSCRGRSLG